MDMCLAAYLIKAAVPRPGYNPRGVGGGAYLASKARQSRTGSSLLSRLRGLPLGRMGYVGAGLGALGLLGYGTSKILGGARQTGKALQDARTKQLSGLGIENPYQQP
jgi:hypothetical protein